MVCKAANNVSCTLSAAISSTGQTTATLQSGEGTLFADCNGTDYTYATVENNSGATREIVKVTNRSGDQITIARAQDGTTATTFAIGDKVERRWNAAQVKETPVDNTDTEAWGDNSTKIASTEYVDRLRSVPPQAKSADYTIALTDMGQSVDGDTGGITFTIPANSAVAFPVGATVSFANRAATSVSIAITTDTLRLAGTTSTGTRTLSGYGMATIRKVSATVWFISGAGLS